MARVGPGRQVVSTYPTFEMIPRYTEQRGAELVETPWWSGAFPTEDLIASINDQTDAVFIVSPNNPTGAVATEADLRKVAAETPLLVLDAAYTEFADEDLTRSALELGNVVVIRTMSKAYGLAGLRVGYLLGPPELVTEVGVIWQPVSGRRVVRRSGHRASGATRVRAHRIRRRGEAGTGRTDLGSRSISAPGLLPPRPTSCSPSVTMPRGWCRPQPHSGSGCVSFRDARGWRRWFGSPLPGNRPDFERLARTLGAALAPEAIIFDLDGVLADVSRSQTMAIIETARSFGVEVTTTDIERAKAAGNANDDWVLTRGLCLDRGVEPALDEVMDRFEALYQGREGSPGLKIQETPIVDPRTWSRWAESWPLAVVTGRPRSDAEEFLERFDLRREVSALVTRDDAPLKPDPAPVRLALTTLGVTRAWMLGDTPDDLAAARAAGVVPIGVVAPGDDPIRARESLRNSACILDNTNDLEALLP